MYSRYKAKLENLMGKSYYPYLVLFIITLAALGLRLYKLGEWSFWEDELFSIGNTEDGFNYSIWRRSLAIDLVNWTTAILGVSEWSARLAPALIGAFSIPILYFPIRRVFGPYVGLIFCGLLSLNTWHLYWSQNARFYILLFLFYTLSVLAFYIAVEEDNPWYMVLSLVFLGFAARERLVALMFLPTVVLYLILLKILPFEKPPGFRLRNITIFFGISFVLGIFFAGPYLSNLPAWVEGFSRINNNPIWIFSASVYYIGAVTFIWALFAGIYLLIRRSHTALFFGLVGIIPIVLIMAASLVQYAATRYVFISLTGWVLLASIATQTLFQELKGNSQILAAGVLFLLLLVPMSENILYFNYQNGNRADWRAAFEYIDSQKGSQDIVISNQPKLGDFYMQESTLGYQNTDITQIEQLDEDVWFVEDLVVQELYPQHLAWIRSHAQLVANFDIYASARIFIMRIYHYQTSG